MKERIWHLPEPIAVRPVKVAGDTSIYVRRYGNPDGPRVLLSTGNGFAADMYYPFWSLFEDRFDIILYDLRNHGWNPVSAQEFHNIPTFGEDLLSVFRSLEENFGPKPVVGLLHSLSAFIGISLLPRLVKAGQGAPFAGLVLFDPPILKPGLDQIQQDEMSERLAEKLEMRGTEFRSLDEFVELLNFGGFFRQSVAGAAELAAESLLRWSDERGRYVLRCPPQYEAQIWKLGTAFIIKEDFPRIQYPPIKILGSDPTEAYSFIPTVDFDDLMLVDYDFIPESTHMLQLEHPARCREVACDFMRSIGFICSDFDAVR